MSEQANPAALLAQWLEGAAEDATPDQGLLAAEVAAVLADLSAEDVPIASLACVGGRGSQATLDALESPALAEAAYDFLNAVQDAWASPPNDLLRSTKDALLNSEPRNESPRVVSMQARVRAPQHDRFQLLAAATPGDGEGLICKSESGLWSIEVFEGQVPSEHRSAYLMLSVDEDYRETYEGRSARVFVCLGDEERMLAEATICDGELFVEISLTGLDLRRRDAISVVFSDSAGHVD